MSDSSAWLRRFLLLLTMAIAACGGAQGAPAESALDDFDEVEAIEATETSEPSRGPTTAERRAIDELMRLTASARELSFERTVPIEIENRKRIAERLTSELEEEDLEKARRLYTALGLLPEDLDLRDMLGRLVSEQVVGYYDPRAGRLAVRSDVMRELRAQRGVLDEARIVLVHELVHALQDQRLGLGARFDEDRDTDAENAFRGVVEGDATLAMLGYVIEQSGGTLAEVTRSPELLSGLARNASSLPGDELAASPAIVRVTLLASYLHGMAFVAHLHQRGGWTAVDEAHRDVPVSTEQVLHPVKYERGELPDEIILPPLPALEAAGYVAADEDTLGELEMAVYFAQGTGEDTDARAASGWGGDRIRLYRHEDGRDAVVWFTSWDDVRSANQATDAALRIVRATGSSVRPTHRVERRGRAVLIVRGLPPELHPPVQQAFERFADALPVDPPRKPRSAAAGAPL